MQYLNDTIDLSKSELLALLAFASTDETRAHLAAVSLDPSGLLFATDGHRLLAVELPELTRWRAAMMPMRVDAAPKRAKPAVDAVSVDLAALPEAEPEAPAVAPAPAVVPVTAPAAAVDKPAPRKAATRKAAAAATVPAPIFRSLGRVRQRAA